MDNKNMGNGTSLDAKLYQSLTKKNYFRQKAPKSVKTIKR